MNVTDTQVHEWHQQIASINAIALSGGYMSKTELDECNELLRALNRAIIGQCQECGHHEPRVPAADGVGGYCQSCNSNHN